MSDLKDVEALVQRLTGSSLDTQAITAALSYPVDVDALVAHGRLSQDRYVRVPLYQGETFEIRLLCWGPGQYSGAHGHGGAVGGIRVLRGQAEEIRIGDADQRLQVGDVGVVDAEAVHQVGNPGKEPLYTLHVYAPPLPVDQPSLEEGRRVVVVGGGIAALNAAIQVLEEGDEDLRLTLIDERRGGRGEEERRLAETVTRRPGKLRIVRSEMKSMWREGDGWKVEVSGGRILAADRVVMAGS